MEVTKLIYRGEASSDRDPCIEIPFFSSLCLRNNRRRECCSWAVQYVSRDGGLPCILPLRLFLLKAIFGLLSYLMWPDPREK